MLFQYRSIDFNIDERNINEEDVKIFFDKVLDIAEDIVKIFEIVVSENDFSEIYIEKQETDPQAWDIRTLDFIKYLSQNGYDVLTSDEDYGECFDVILMYDAINN